MMTQNVTESEPEVNTDFWQGYEEWLDEIESKLPPRDGLLNRIAWAVKYSLSNLVRQQPDGSYLVPSRTVPRKHWTVTEAGCECPDFRERKVCAHWLAVGAASNGAFLVARILRSRSVGQLERVKDDWRTLSDSARKTCPPEIELFAALEYHRRRRAFALMAPVPVERVMVPRDSQAAAQGM